MSSQNRSSNVFIFGLSFGVFLALFVLIGSLSSQISLNSKLEIIQKIAYAYVTPIHPNNLTTSVSTIVVGMLWAFLDGFLVGTIFMLIYKQFNNIVNG